ncbi:hypothetical protein DLAC_09336 [Tieghemostelium lacteum]|uniref:RNA helicase n=1 Tax=Tieghemostelium lacteum TaxID=361077 RepID=A0A151Z9S9_TIELA|nr:hypothetical protein DLAC_09336 [Tieghemostelium lacteum]|eukprot:KYQ90702.1 hypothetical protein DLAC_09336 [Tieghemostelium lacteum]
MLNAIKHLNFKSNLFNSVKNVKSLSKYETISSISISKSKLFEPITLVKSDDQKLQLSILYNSYNISSGIGKFQQYRQYCTETTPETVNTSETTETKPRTKFNKKSEKEFKEFTDLPIRKEIMWAIEDMGWKKPTEIQSNVIPQIFSRKRNILFSSQTGSGKTAAYLLPLLQIVSKRPDFDCLLPMALVLAPSKELAIQIDREARQLCSYIKKFRIQLIIGGVGEHTQIEDLSKGCDLVVATPGRLLELIKMKKVSMHHIKMVVIDEFDKLFNLGFFPDMKELFRLIPHLKNKTREKGVQTVLLSATIMHEKYDELITRFAPYHLMVNQNTKLTAPEQIKQYFYGVSYRQKSSLLLYFLRRGGKTSLKNIKTLAFVRTQQRAEKLSEFLKKHGIEAAYIHADMSLAKRNDLIKKFSEPDSPIKLLVSTDVLARGIHIENLGAVVNVDVPHVAEDYLHRIGRAGRLDSEGFSLTFVSNTKLIFQIGERTVGLDEAHLLSNIKFHIGDSEYIRLYKIPGPWKGEQQIDDKTTVTIDDYEDGNDAHIEYNENDERYNNNNNNQKTKEKSNFEKREKKAVADLLIKKRILEPVKGPKTRDGLPRVKFNPNAKVHSSKMAKIIVDRKGEIHDLPPLTDFQEGQYENVVSEFDKNRARKRGVHFAPQKRNPILPSKVQTKRQLKYNSNNRNSN